ncbi:unnamed protein product [Arctogadus glacialis]
MRPRGSYGDTEERSRTPRPPSPVVQRVPVWSVALRVMEEERRAIPQHRLQHHLRPPSVLSLLDSWRSPPQPHEERLLGLGIPEDLRNQLAQSRTKQLILKPLSGGPEEREEPSPHPVGLGGGHTASSGSTDLVPLKGSNGPSSAVQSVNILVKREKTQNTENQTRRTSRCQLIRDGDEGQRASSQQEVRRRTLEGLSECPIREDLQQQSAAGTPSSHRLLWSGILA